MLMESRCAWLYKKREGIAEADRDWFLLVNKSVIQIKIDFTVIILTFQALS